MADARRAVFLDRDGVLNRSDVRNGRPYAPTTLDRWVVLPEAPASVRRLKAAGFLTIVVTNQKDIGEGLVEREMVDEMNRRLREAMPIDALYMCTCIDNCPCYKPNPGMLLDASRDFGIDLSASFMVGDRDRDVGAGQRAGCRTIFVERGYTEPMNFVPDHVVADVAAAADLILALDARGS